MNKRSLFATLGAVAALVLVFPNISFAATDASSCFSLTSGLSPVNCVTWFMYIISYVISSIALIIFAIESFALHMAINLNFTIANNPGVQLGFSVVLAFANIFFVAAVIIMAVATIVRYDAYGYKNLLFKIVVAAIGVNFSLIVAGTVIDVSDQFTKFFLNNAIPNPAATQGVDARPFVDNLAGAFNPGSLYNIETIASSSGQAVNDASAALQETSGAFGTMIAGVLGIFMTALMAVLMAIFMGVLAGAFFVRFIFLALLLTIMPAVWVAWVFPFGSGFFNFWKKNFIKWTLFAPVMMFFLYLATKTIEAYNSMHIFDTETITREIAEPGGASDYITNMLKSLAEPILTNVVKFALVAGTLYGGLLIAAKMGISAGDAGAKAFTKIGGSMKRAVQQRAASVQKGAVNAGMRNVNRLRTIGKDEKGNSFLKRRGSELDALASKSRIARIAGLGVAGRSMANVGAGDKKGAEARQKDYETEFKNLTPDALQARLKRLRMQTLAEDPDQERAIVNVLKEQKELGGIGKSLTAKQDAAFKACEADQKAKNRTLSPDQITQKKAELAEEYRTEREAEETKLRKQLKRLSDGGALKDILAAAPKLAKFAPTAKTKDKNPRPMTEEEMQAAAVATAKGDNVEAIAYETDMFGPIQQLDGFDAKHLDADGALKKEYLEQLLNANAVSNEQLKQISDKSIDTATAIKNTLEMISLWDDELRQKGHDGDRKWKALDRHIVDTDQAGKDGKPLVAGANQLTRRNAAIKANSQLRVLKKNVNIVLRRSDIFDNDDRSTGGNTGGAPNPPVPPPTGPAGPTPPGGGGRGPNAS